MKNILIVDDQIAFLESLKDGLKPHADHFAVLTAATVPDAIRVLRKRSIDLVVTDLMMPDINGFELLAFLKEHDLKVEIIVMTAFATRQIERRLAEFGLAAYLEKPIDFRELVETILQRLHQHSSRGIEN